MKGTVMLLTPSSERRGGRARAVSAALETRGWTVVRLDTGLPKRQRGHGGWLPDYVARAQLKGMDRVIVLPRADYTIGAGTLRDIRLAEQLDKPVLVVRNDGQLVPLREVRLELLGDDYVNAARIEWVTAVTPHSAVNTSARGLAAAQRSL